MIIWSEVKRKEPNYIQYFDARVCKNFIKVVES